jgi:hypothetical protein
MQEHSIGGLESVNSRIGLPSSRTGFVSLRCILYEHRHSSLQSVSCGHGVAEKADFAGFFTDDVEIHSLGLLRASHAIL